MAIKFSDFKAVGLTVGPSKYFSLKLSGNILKSWTRVRQHRCYRVFTAVFFKTCFFSYKKGFFFCFYLLNYRISILGSFQHC